MSYQAKLRDEQSPFKFWVQNKLTQQWIEGYYFLASAEMMARKLNSGDIEQ